MNDAYFVLSEFPCALKTKFFIATYGLLYNFEIKLNHLFSGRFLFFTGPVLTGSCEMEACSLPSLRGGIHPAPPAERSWRVVRIWGPSPSVTREQAERPQGTVGGLFHNENKYTTLLFFPLLLVLLVSCIKNIVRFHVFPHMCSSKSSIVLIFRGFVHF